MVCGLIQASHDAALFSLIGGCRLMARAEEKKTERSGEEGKSEA